MLGSGDDPAHRPAVLWLHRTMSAALRRLRSSRNATLVLRPTAVSPGPPLNAHADLQGPA